jgi:hypothetical protein
LRPTRPLAQPAPLASLLSRAEFNSAGPSRSAQARRWRNCRSTFSSLIHAFCSWRLLSIHQLTLGVHLLVSSSPPRWPAPAVTPPRRRSSDAAEPLPPASSLSPLNPPSNRALTGLNDLNHHSPPLLLRPPLRCPPTPIKAPEDPRSFSPLTELLPSPLPCRNAPPTEFPDHHRAAAMPGRHTTAHAPVSRPPNSPRLTPPLLPLGRRPWTPEWPDAEAPVSLVPPSTVGPPWTRVPVVHGPVDPVYGKFFMKIIR